MQQNLVPLAAVANTFAVLCQRIEEGEAPDAVTKALFTEVFEDVRRQVDLAVAFKHFLEAQIEDNRAWRNQYDSTAKALEKTLDLFTDRVGEVLESVSQDGKKVPLVGTGKNKIQFQRNSSAPVEYAFGDEKQISKAVIDLFGVPERFYKVTYELRSAEVKKAIEAGEEIPWAKVGEPGQHVRFYPVRKKPKEVEGGGRLEAIEAEASEVAHV